jgi:hypothetical protein
VTATSSDTGSPTVDQRDPQVRLRALFDHGGAPADIPL